MDVTVDKRWEGLLKSLVESGHYQSASAVVSEGLRLVEEREAKRQWLREKIERSIERGGSHTDEEVAEAIEARLRQLDLPDDAP